MTPIVDYLQLRDITISPGGGSANVIASDTGMLAFDLPIEVDAVSQAMIEVANNSPLATALTLCAGGAIPSTATKKYHCEISFSGTSAGPFDYRFVVEKVIRGLTVVASGRCIYAGYVDNAVARLTLNRTRLDGALNGTAGSIRSQPDPSDSGVISYTFPQTASNGLPAQKGLFQTNPNPPDGYVFPPTTSPSTYYTMPVVVAPAIAGLLVDGDSKDNFIDAAAKEFIALSVGLPLDGTPLGSYSHIVADTSDASLNLTSITKGIAVGPLGTFDFLTFARNPSPTDTAKALLIEPPEGLLLTTDLGGTLAKIKPSGGFSNHGLPVGFTIADGLCIPNNKTDSSTVHWYDSLFVFVGSDASGLGGLYCWPHNELAYRIGQALDFATCVAYDEATNKIYVGCKYGVYSVVFNPFALTANLTREGSLNMNGTLPGAGTVVAVRVGANSTITAQIQGSGAADGVYKRDPTAPPGYSYDGWYAFDTAGPLIGYHYDASGDTLYTAYPDNAAVLIKTNNASSSNPTITDIPINGGAHIEGIDDLGGLGGGVRTADGALGMYVAAGTLTDLNMDLTLVNRYGAAPRVNRIQLAAANLHVDGLTDQTARLVANTDAGPYVSGLDAGGQWKAMPKQSGIGAQTISGTAIGQPQTLGGDSTQPGRLVSRVYCWPNLWISHSGGIWFDDELQERTDLGPFIHALGVLSLGNQRSFLDNDVTVVGFYGESGKPDAPAAAGTSGRAVYVSPAAIAANGLQGLPPTALYLRPLDERNRWVHLFVDTASASPTGRIITADFSTIQSDNATPAATASGKVAQATARKYMDTAIVPHDVQFDSVMAFQEMNLRRLRPSHRVATDYDTTPYYSVNLSSTTFYVRKVRFYKQRGDNQVQVQVDASTVFRAASPSDQAIGDGLGATVSKMIRQGRQP